MNQVERRTAFSLSSVYAIRLFGLFIIFPVFALHSNEFNFSTPLLVGIALGIYGLTQALLQIPMGVWSDRVGRKPIIVFGFLVFCVGSVIAALSDSIYGVIIGRALQGAGAVASTMMALAADLSREEQRSKINAIIGGGIALAFAIALLLGPILQARFGLAGLFWLSALLAIVAIGIIHYVVPTPDDRPPIALDVPKWPVHQLAEALSSKELWRLYFGVFTLHLAMTTNFLILPAMIVERLHLASAEHWIFYLFILVISVLLMWPALVIGEKKNRVKGFFITAIIIISFSQYFWYNTSSASALIIFMTLFFATFSYLEANLPALVSRVCRVDNRGSCMGAFSTAQFLGIFFGSTSAGFIIEWQGVNIVLFSTTMLLVWFFVAFGMKPVTVLSRHAKGGLEHADTSK